jgi:hypothetical protein
MSDLSPSLRGSTGCCSKTWESGTPDFPSDRRSMATPKKCGGRSRHGAMDQKQTLERLRALAETFPDRADIRAHCLRFSWVEVRLRRSEDRLMTGDISPSPPKVQIPTPDLLARFLHDVDAGERLDPDNSYFPLMRAIGLFAAHRDAEALAAVERE